MVVGPISQKQFSFDKTLWQKSASTVWGLSYIEDTYIGDTYIRNIYLSVFSIFHLMSWAKLKVS